MMRVPIRNKLIISYLLVSVLTACIIYVLTYFTSSQRVEKLAKSYQVKEMVTEVRNWYVTEGGWEGFSDYFFTLHPPQAPKHLEGDGSQFSNKKAGILTADRVALLDYLTYAAGDIVPEAYLARARPVRYQGSIVAYVIPPEATGINLDSQLQVFLDTTQEVLIIAVAIGIVVSLIFGVAIATVGLKPISLLTRATSKIASGELGEQVATTGNDEIGELSRAFNKMSQDLAAADQQRRQLTADITHDLGTPVQVISGYVELAQEGILELNQERLDIVSSELSHIQLLLKDMSLLAQTDAKSLAITPTDIDIDELLNRVKRLYQLQCDEKQIALRVESDATLPLYPLDEERMVQVLGNLVSNAIRYVPEHGSIVLKAEGTNSRLMIAVEDNGCGIREEDLPQVFDRFYRADPSRSGQSGKMGLGLSIAKGLVELQGGSILCESDGNSYCRFVIEFPLQGD